MKRVDRRKTREKRRLKPVLKLLLIFVCLCALIGLSVLTAVCIRTHAKRELRPSDCIIVLGARVWADGRMSNSLTYRCESALEAYRSGVAGKLIACGAQGSDEPFTEASAMRDYFIQNGVPEADILMDEASENTRENLKNAKAFMDENGWTSAVVVTSDYHVERALWLARDEGIDACGIAAESPHIPYYYVTGRLRETVSWILYFLNLR